MLDGLINIMIKLVNIIILSVGTLVRFLVNILPDSPFKVLGNIEIDYLSSLNWVIPITFMITVLAYWLGGIVLYYVISIPMRWSKVIE